jgi:hypothetical protein
MPAIPFLSRNCEEQSAWSMCPLLNVDIAGAIAFIGCDIGQVTGVGLAVWTMVTFT